MLTSLRTILVVALTACVLGSVTTSCGDASSKTQKDTAAGTIAQAVERAKERGETAVEIFSADHAPLNQEGLDSILREYSVVVAIPSSESMIELGGDGIYTWRRFRATKYLSKRRPMSYPACDVNAPTRISIAPGEFVLPLLTGTATLDGVVVTQRSRESRLMFEPGRRYVLVAQICNDRLMRLPHGQSSVFSIDEAGRLGSTGLEDQPYSVELLSLGTLERLERRLSRLGVQ